MGKYFGTDGFRGEAGITLTADHAYKVGRFFGWYYNMIRERNNDHKPARIVIGKDTRRSSYMFEYSLVAGLTASGADAYLLHVTTTPSVAYIARVDDFDCGIMISASHNPYYDNGIKLIDCYGEKMPEEILLLVEDYIDGKLHVFDKDWPELPFAHREHIGCTVDYVSGRNRYMGYLISLGIYSFKGVKVGLDCANGSSWNIAKSVFDALGADTYVINNQPNGLNINNNAGSTHIEGLQKLVVEKGLDVGFAYDGDADRCLCVDEKGNVITGDHILYIYGCYMKERGKLLTNTVVTTVMSNFGLYKAFDEKGIGYCKTATSSNTRYDTVLNRSYQELADYYGTAIVPARVRRPKDKSSAEASVRFAETWIIAALRDRKFFSLQEVNEAVAEKLEELNGREFQQRTGTRRSAYLEEEQPYMLPLPATPFESAVWSVAKVPNDYLVSDGRNKYSVPYNLIGEKVDVRVTKNLVEVYYHGSRVASHRRLQTLQRDPLVKLEHMAETHQKYLTYNEDDFKVWAMSVGPMTEHVVDFFLESGKAPEQGYKACASLTKLGKWYGKERLESACARVHAYGTTPSIRNISSILKSKQDVKAKTSTAQEQSSKTACYGITRGASYFANGGEHK